MQVWKFASAFASLIQLVQLKSYSDSNLGALSAFSLLLPSKQV